MAKVLFVTHDGLSHEPLGIEYLSACLKQAGHETKACMAAHAVETAGRWRADFAAFQILTGDQDKWGAIAKKIKSAFPTRVKTIFGGPHFLYFGKEGQYEADTIVRGDGFRSIVAIAEGRTHKDFDVVTDLDSLPHPDRSLLYNDDFPLVKGNVIRNFINYFSCPFACTYCFNSVKEWQSMVSSHRLRHHSPEWIIDDIERTFKDWGGELVSFQDDIFAVHMEWLERFVVLYGKVRIPFFAQARPAFITEDRIKLLKEAGIHILSFAIESGVEETRKLILDRHETNEQIEQACKLLQKYGVRFRIQNLLGLPVDDPLGDALRTLQFNMRMRPTLSWCSLLQCYPGTAIADYVVKKGIVNSQDELIPMANSTFFEETSLPVKDRRKIARLHKYWSAVIRWPWLYWIVRFLVLFNFGKRWEQWIFNKTKQYINQREYWRVDRKFADHISTVR